MFQCKVILDNTSASFHTDSHITGLFKCHCKNNVRIRSVKIRLDCIEYVNVGRWFNFVKYDNYNVIYSAEEIVYSAKRGVKQISKTEMVYPFKIYIPRDLPSTFHHTYGKVFYVVTGTIVPFIWNDFTDSFVITVDSPVEMRAMTRSFQKENFFYKETTFRRFGFRREGKLIMQICLPRIAFVAGDIIDFKVFVKNDSSEKVKCLGVKFSKRVKFKPLNYTNTYKQYVETILKFKKDGIDAKAERIYNIRVNFPEVLDIPNLQSCSLIKLEFILKIWCQMPIFLKDNVIEIHPEMGHHFTGIPSSLLNIDTSEDALKAIE